MKKLKGILIGAMLGSAALLTGCSVNDVASSMRSYLYKEASVQEETAEESAESRIFPVQVNNAAGEPLVNSQGEPVTVLAVYETATGGEDRINEKGIAETYPVGQIMTYKAGETVTDEDGNPETYAGGESVTNVFGNPARDENKEFVTRSAGEIVTRAAGEIIYDADGNKVYSRGEPLTYEAGEYMYDTSGAKRFSGITLLKNEDGVSARDEAGDPLISVIEIVTDESGDPLMEEDGEVATRVLEPLLPEPVIEQPVEEGVYYVRNITSKYVYFSAPLVPAANITVPEGSEITAREQLEALQDPSQPEEVPEAGADAAESPDEIASGNEDPDGNQGEGAEAGAAAEDPDAGSEEQSAQQIMINNLQLEILGENLPGFELRYDAWGYGYFVMPDTEQVLGFDGAPGNGVNVLLQDMKKIPYPQYAYWDDPLYYLEDTQRWMIQKLPDGNFRICSAADPDYCLTVDDRSGIHYANIMLWKADDRDQQKFAMQTQVPTVEKVIEEGTYFIRTGLSDWMVVSIGDFNVEDGRNIYLYHADGLDGQQFKISYDEYGLATITHSDSTKVLSIENQEAVSGHSVFQYEADGGDWQKWILDPIPDDTGFIIRSAKNVSVVLNLMSSVVNELQPIRLYWNDNTKAQNWYFETQAPEAPATYETMEKYAQKFYSDTGYLILVNTITNHLGVYTGYMGNWTCIAYWDCVTGKPSTPTIKGHYSVLGRIPSFDGDTDSPELYTCYYATMFYPEYFIHSIVYYAGTMDVMDATMGWNASHGCVRLYIENAQWIYENIPDGTAIQIF